MSGFAAISDNCAHFKAQLDKDGHVLDVFAVFGLHAHRPPLLKPRSITSMAVKVDLSLLFFSVLLFLRCLLRTRLSYIEK